ncbi:MAG: OmpA family protein [Chitinispirillaceae bacterium]|nr:OmpA family protein [Chitinispirillaceae bacterium]
MAKKVEYSQELKDEYRRLFDTCVIKENKVAAADGIIEKMQGNKARYDSIEQDLGIPWYVVAAIHQMESGMSFSRHLHNGDPLTARTVHVPKGRPLTPDPPYTWEYSANDVLKYKLMDKWTDWSIEGVLFKLEGYNGWGYRLYHPDVLSAYLWSSSNHHTSGRYVADGKWSQTAISKRCGAAVILRRMVDEHIITIDGANAHSGAKGAYLFPVDLGKTLEPTADNVGVFHRHVEKDHDGGYYPLGANTTWHGGVHLRVSRGSAVCACADGEIVAAKLGETKETACGHYGSMNFILLRHTVSGSSLNRQFGADSNEKKFDDADRKELYSLYMHLNAESLDEASGKYPWLSGDPESGGGANADLVESLKSGEVVKVENIKVQAGDALWSSGEYGSDPAELIHWELFSPENLLPSFVQAVDDDEDTNMDSQKIFRLVDQDSGWFDDMENLTAEEVIRFYKNDPEAATLRKHSCKFVSEWALNLDVAIPQMKGRFLTIGLKDRMEPYMWWPPAKVKGVQLPESKHVWHYNPIQAIATLAGTKKKVRYLEVENSLFRFDSVAFLPDGHRDEKGAEEQEKVSGIPVLKEVLLHAAKNPGRKLLIAGHTDASGSDDYNFKLSLKRAQSVYYVLINEKDTWARNADEKHHDKDIQHVLKWAAGRRKWNCDPGDVDGKIGPKTKAAINNFRKAAGINESESFDVESWKIVFDLYQEELERIMQTDDEAKNAFAKRGELQWAYEGDNRVVGCGELFPKEEGKKESQVNRRVEILFFDAGDVPECMCENGACTKKKCRIYNKNEIIHIPIPPEPEPPEPVKEDPSEWFVPYLPVTGNNNITIYRDGESYCADLYDAINATKSGDEITLLGLHFAGHFHLKRPSGTKPNNYADAETLQDLLAKKSKLGVKIYLLVNVFWKNEGDIIKDYEKSRRDLDLWTWKLHRNPVDTIKDIITDSGLLAKYLKYTCNFFEYLKNHGEGKNIHAYCDLHKGIVMHTNHQKTIIINRKIAFLGGIDLTDIDGDRFDTHAHTPNNPVRNYDKPERNWHDIHMKIVKASDDDPPCGVDFVYANFLGRYNYGYLYNPVMTPEDKMPEELTGVQLNPDIPQMRNGDVSLEKAENVEKLLVDGRDTKDYVQPGELGYVYPENADDQKLTYPVVQIVRSMPSGNDDNYRDNQKPDWNKNTEVTDYECSARDTYIHAIKAADKFIYLENQWVADERIWEALDQKAEEKKDDPDFRITLVIPKKFLTAAGYGRDQDKNLDDEVEGLHEKLGERFGLFSILQPAGQHDKKATHEHYKVPQCVWEYMYVHSKIMIVDDVWVLIGSANAGGISLTGTGFKSEPDAELSAAILDKRQNSIVTAFRKELLAEHLGSDFGDFKSCHDEMRKQAINHNYDAEKEKKVHFNVLYFPLVNRVSSGKWKYLDWRILSKQAEMRKETPNGMNQTYYNLSGPLTVLHMLASMNGSRYKKLANDIFFNARSEDCDIDVSNSETDLLDEQIPPDFPILEIDWMLGSAMMDSENWFWDYEGGTDKSVTGESVASSCSDSDMEEFMEKVIPCKEGVTLYSCDFWGVLDEAEKADKALTHDSKSPDETAVAVKVALPMFLEENKAAQEQDKDKPSYDRGDPKYWISYLADDNPFLKLQRDRIAGYPGVITPWDIKHILSDTVFIRLMEPLEFTEDAEGNKDRVKMTFWSWGKISSLTMSIDTFKKNVNGFFVGFLSKNAKKAFDNADETVSGELKLSNGFRRIYIHKSINDTDVIVTCKSGSIRVEVSAKLYSWEVKATETVSAGKTFSKKVEEMGIMKDQSTRVRITGLADSVYTINMKSTD